MTYNTVKLDMTTLSSARKLFVGGKRLPFTANNYLKELAMIQNKKGKKATIKDVASLAGVSVASVSRFLNNRQGHLSAQKALIIGRAIDLLDYVPNNAARVMKTKKSKMIAVVMANIDDYFSTEVFKGASNILKSQGYQAFLLDTGADQNQEKSLIKTVRNKDFDGLLFQPLGSNVDIISDEILHNIPTVIIDRDLATSKWPRVVSNNFAVAKEATQYFFVEKKCSSVLILTSKIAVAYTRKERYEGVCSVAKNSQVHVIELAEEAYNNKIVFKELTSFLDLQKKKKQKTLIFCFKERWLLEFIPSLISQGYLTDDQVFITGFADTKIAHALLPQSRLISQNPYLMGASAAEILLSNLIGNDFKSQNNKVIVRANF